MDEKTVQFKFTSPILMQLSTQLRKHALYQYAIDLLSKNKHQQDFHLSIFNEQVE